VAGDEVQHLLDTEAGDALFLAGCAETRSVLPQFDHVVLLSAPAEVSQSA